MTLRLALAMALLDCSTCSAALVRVEFAAELQSWSPQLNPVPTLTGYFQFEDINSERGTYLSGNGQYHYSDIVQIGIWSSSGLITADQGLVIVNHESRPTTGNYNYALARAYQYLVSIGVTTYPTPMPEIDLNLGNPPPDYGDIVILPVAYPTVFNPVVTLSMFSRANDSAIGDSLTPPSLDLVDEATLTLHYQRYGVYKSGGGFAYGLIRERATYTITSLRTVPEPGAITSIVGALPLIWWLRARARCSGIAGS